MKKKLATISILLGALIALATISVPISASDLQMLNVNKNVTIEVNLYSNEGISPIFTNVNEKKAIEIQEIITELSKAIDKNDEASIKYFESKLNEMGIFGDQYQEFFSKQSFYNKMDFGRFEKFSKWLTDNNDDNISNSFCFFNTIGEGLLVSTLGILVWEAFVRLLSNASSFAEAFVIIILFLPFVLSVIVLTGLIPFRVAMPTGMILVENGTISSLGLNGYKKLQVTGDPVYVNLSVFTGITISIPGNEDTGRDAFLFVSGFALQVYESETS
jgi:hypothetical protein